MPIISPRELNEFEFSREELSESPSLSVDPQMSQHSVLRFVNELD